MMIEDAIWKPSAMLRLLRMIMKRWFFLVVLLNAVGTAADQSTSYYHVARAPFAQAGTVEIRPSGGYDFSNPYFHLYSINLGAVWLASPMISAGLEFSKFTGDKRNSALALEKELGDYGFTVDTLIPRFCASIALRLVPLAGMVNFFTTRVLMVDFGLLARGGFIKYSDGSAGPLVGASVEVGVRPSPAVGVHLILLWDGEKPKDRSWQSRVGFRVGPSFRL